MEEEGPEQPRRLTAAEVLAKRIPLERRTRPTRDAPEGYRYIVGPHEGPNHALRRKARLLQERRWRNYMSWRRQLARVGIDPDAVLRKREEKARARLAPGSVRPDGGHDAGESEMPRQSA